ncbi:MAG TPA: lipopolysaccharide kinase InaA family protein [Accumulibacter sp.]|uniref:lipopolysaccharide kinase InaA family protein n=1 Tax=Accumulibacter sp. TaxID=2053492 RepID=UPI002BB5408F|nr:lipopolysaccharide kinase InaA family protein [Accumulibacter sp.]HRF72850.1 lipopolysaccharide kinase InaA family protein [Accumulibacter sp.]
MLKEYINDDWLPVLQHNHLDSFEALWDLNKDDWFEPPNYRRGGWSGVVRTAILLPDGTEVGVFIKRQENHFFRSWRNFFRLTATFEREFRNLLNFRRLGVPTLEPIYYCQKTVDGKLRAIVVTRELEGYQPFDAQCYNPISQIGTSRRGQVISRVAKTLRTMHDARLQHNCLYLKHVFVKEGPDGAVDARLIDLEKAKWRPIKSIITTRDLYSLYRCAEGWSRTDRLRFFLAYRNEEHLGSESKKLLRGIVRRLIHKNRRV